ncbi:hypothetical protein LFM09_33695 [Lentzea alba]|uniref:hypothetical protein n=1 Tax=Lentzea alba TaxID=2714351 RepID=UPI0039BEE2CA
MRRLSDEEESLVHSAIGALEIAHGIVPESALPALTEPALRAAVVERLEQCGRVLNKVRDGWTSGYDDNVADVLVREGIGVLKPVDRAVLTLVLLRCVAVPRARGAASGETWADGRGTRPTSTDELAQSRHLTKSMIKQSLRRLQAAGLVNRGSRGITPGPALHRLTPRRTAALWEDMVILAASESPYARVLLKRRGNGNQHKPPAKDEK